MATWNDISAPVFNIEFDYDIGVSSLTADFSNLMGADDPSLSVAIPWRDCWAEIMDLIPDTGGQVIFLEGEYIYSTTLLCGDRNVSIKGQGIDKTIFKLIENVPRRTKGFYSAGSLFFEIQDLTIDGNSLNNRTYYDRHHTGIWTENAETVNIQNIKCRDVYAWAGIERACIFVKDSNRAKITGCYVINAEDGSGIYCANVAELVIQNNPLIADCRGYGIYIDFCDNITITGNVVRGIVEPHFSAAIGVVIFGNYATIVGNDISFNSHNLDLYTLGATITGNTLVGALYGCGIRLSIIESHKYAISGNTCNDNKHYGMDIWGDNHTIVGNTCNGNKTGIYLNLANKCNVQTNICSDNEEYGIQVYMQSNHNTITNNHLIDNGLGGLSDHGTGTITTAGNRV